MRAGLLTELVTIKKAEVEKNEYGQEETIWNDYLVTRANVTYKTGSRDTENNENINTYTVDFTVRSYHIIDEFMRILWNGNIYRILSINRDKRKQSITITGELING